MTTTVRLTSWLLNSRHIVLSGDCPALAGHEHIHKGMTSRDLTENVEQLQIYRSLELVRGRAVAVLNAVGNRAAEYRSLVMAGRSHNVAAQATTLGKRFASAADEMLVALDRVEDLLSRYPLRGIKGPMGTAQDMLDLVDADEAKLNQLERGRGGSWARREAANPAVRTRSTPRRRGDADRGRGPAAVVLLAPVS